jgi:acetyl-CoA acetyltransferase
MDREVTQHTKDFLAQELRAAGLNEMADKAAQGYYHDFLSPLVAPELQLLSDLHAAGTPAAMALHARHMNGEFDASKEESDEWAASEDGQAAFNELVGSVRK